VIDIGKVCVTMGAVRRWFVLAAFSAAIAACGGGGGGGAGTPVKPPPPLTMTPSTVTLDSGTPKTFSAAGGVAPYTYSIVSGGGVVDSSSGLFTSPTSAATVIVKVTDSAGTVAEATVTVAAPLVAVPTTATSDAGGSQVFKGSGGQGPYTFSIVSGGGTIDAKTGQFTAPSIPGSVVVGIMDSAGVSSSVTITVNTPLVLAPTTASIPAGSTKVFTGTGGQTPYTFSTVSGGGTIDAASGMYTSPATAGTATIQVTDALGSAAQALITLYPPLAVTPASITVTAGSDQTNPFAGVNGIPPYSYALTSGPGSLDAAGVYTVGTASGIAVVTATDSVGSTATAQVRSLRIRVNGAVIAAVNDRVNWWLGGQFNATNPYSAPRVAVVDATTGAPQIGCDLQSGFLEGDVIVVLTSGNSIYLGGQFAHYRGVAVNNLVKLDATTCAIDPVFAQSGGLGTNGSLVWSMALYGGSLYVAGNFTQYRAAPVTGLIKIDATTGVLDTNFTPQSPAGTASNGLIAISGSSLYVAGIDSHPNASNVPFLLKLIASTGAVDPTFPQSNTFDGPVKSLAVNGNSLYVGGEFKHYGATRVDFAKLDASTAAIDPAFASATMGYTGVDAMVFNDTALYIGREFPGPGGVPSTLAKLDAGSGVTDANFTQTYSLDYGVFGMALSGTSLYIGGSFTTYRGAPAWRLAKVNAATGALDTAFTQTTGVNSNVRSLAFSGSNLVVGGDFSTYRGRWIGSIAKFDITGNIADPTFTQGCGTGPNGDVTALALVGASLYASGYFTTFNGANAAFLAKIDPTSAVLDTTFTQPIGPSGGPVLAILPANGALYIGGGFTSYRGAATGSLLKVDPITGTADATFSAGAKATGTVNALASSGSSLYLGGAFGTYGANPAVNLAKVDLATAALDTTFTQVTGAGVVTTSTTFSEVLALSTSGGSLYVGGYLQSYRGLPISGVAKVDAISGALDTTFTASNALAGGLGNAFLVSGPALYLGGAFFTYQGAIAQALAKVDATNGALDTTFNTSAGGVCTQGDGTQLCSGNVMNLTLLGNQLFIGSYYGETYRGKQAYYFYPVDATTGALLDP
jgi:hypothetical protein